MNSMADNRLKLFKSGARASLSWDRKWTSPTTPRNIQLAYRERNFTPPSGRPSASERSERRKTWDAKGQRIVAQTGVASDGQHASAADEAGKAENYRGESRG